MLGGYPLTKQFSRRKVSQCRKSFLPQFLRNLQIVTLETWTRISSQKTSKNTNPALKIFVIFFSIICMICIVPKNSNVVIYARKTLFLLKIRRRPRCWKNFEKNRIVPKKPKGLLSTFACIKRFRFRLLRQEKIRVNLSAK